jgi:hypothetical protein
MKVALWSRFPSSFLSEKIEPKLRERGITVTLYLSDRTKDVDLSDVTCVLFMHELSSHQETAKLETLCADQAKKKFALSRKASHWDRDLQHLPKVQLNETEKQILLEQALDEQRFKARSKSRS